MDVLGIGRVLDPENTSRTDTSRTAISTQTYGSRTLFDGPGARGRARGVRLATRPSIEAERPQCLTLGMEGILLVALVVAALIILRLWVYKARHPYTEADVKGARKDSIDRSRSVISGKVQEHLAPLFPQFLSQFNPKDVRFIGTPLDFVVFDGLDEGNGVRRVVFVEIKTGKSSLQQRERHAAMPSRPGVSSIS